MRVPSDVSRAGLGEGRPHREPLVGGEEVMSRVFVVLAVVVLFWPALAEAATPELSSSHRLQDRGYAATSQRTRVIGFEDGRFYANGWHIAGEMGGIWREPIKLVDGVWFGIGDEWVGQATRFTSGWGYVKFDLPRAGGLQLERADFAPDGRRAAPDRAEGDQSRRSRAHGHGEGGRALRAAGGLSLELRQHAACARPVADTAAVEDGALLFREDGALPHPNATTHHYASLVASDRRPMGAEVNAAANGHRGPRAPTSAGPRRPRAPATTVPSARARAGSCAMRCLSPAVARRRSGSPWPAPTRA
jgi:hypothetical protein